MTTPETLLDVAGVVSGYGRVSVLDGIDLTVGVGEVVTVIGANGAGKSTLLKTIVGFVRPWSGCVTFDGVDITGAAPDRAVRRGLAYVPEGRMLFGPMTVDENLTLGAHSRPGSGKGPESTEDRAFVRELFPVLGTRAKQSAETLSGGEQQMLGIGRALMSRPRLLLLDEPSLGLAPRVVTEIFRALETLREHGVSILLVEQDVNVALNHADRGYVMRTGVVELTGSAAELLANPHVRHIYLGAWQATDEGDTP